MQEPEAWDILKDLEKISDEYDVRCNRGLLSRILLTMHDFFWDPPLSLGSNCSSCLASHVHTAVLVSALGASCAGLDCA